MATKHGPDRSVTCPALGDISAVVITRDAAATLARCLASLDAFPEVLVFDNGSTDDTTEIARRFGNVRLELGEFAGFGATRNKAACLAGHDWIFMVDSDEIASETLVASLAHAGRDDPARVYLVERHNYFMGRRVRHSGWGGDWLPRIYHRGHHRYSDAVVHENIVLGPASRAERLEGALTHLAVRELGQFLVKVNRYSELRSQAARRVHSPATVLFRAGWAFFRTYVLRLGFLDGWRGLVIAWSNSNGVFFKYMKPYANRRAEERPPPANSLEKKADSEYCINNQFGHIINPIQETAMPSAVKAIPEGYESVIPYLVVNDGEAAIEFYKKVFDATEVMRFDDRGRIGHAELKIGDGIFMLADEYPDMGYRSPEPGKLPPAGMMVYVQNVDAVVERAVREGATVEKPVSDQFYGDRAGGIVDPFGHRWYIATHIEDLSPEEIGQRAAAGGGT